MTRAPASLVIHLLAQEAVDKGRPELVIKAATLRQWKARKHLSAGRGYDLTEILTYIEKRTERAA